MQVKIDIVNMREFQAQLAKLETAVGKEVRVKALLAGAEIVRADAARRAPRAEPRPSHPDIGHLADHIVTKTTVNKKNETQVAVGPDAKHFYGGFIERGYLHKWGKKVFGKRAARPWLRPALDENMQKVQDAIRETLREQIRRLTGSV